MFYINNLTMRLTINDHDQSIYSTKCIKYFIVRQLNILIKIKI